LIEKFSPIGQLITWAILSKITGKAQIWWLLFSHAKICALILTKMGWATVWANSSGHPGSN
jgi:hypothetical protein